MYKLLNCIWLLLFPFHGRWPFQGTLRSQDFPQNAEMPWGYWTDKEVSTLPAGREIVRKKCKHRDQAKVSCIEHLELVFDWGTAPDDFKRRE